MRRATLLPLAALVLPWAAAVLSTPEPASACSLLGPVNRLFPEMARKSEVVAVGRLVDATADSITLVVSEGLKGARAGDRFQIYNRRLSLSPACEVSAEADGDPGLYHEGGPVVALLYRGETGDRFWTQYSRGGLFELEDDGELTPLPRFPGEQPYPLADDVIAAVRREAATALDPGFESRGPCNSLVYRVDRTADYLRMSPVVVDGVITAASPETVTLHAREYLRGDGGQTLTINVRDLGPEGGGCRVLMSPYVREKAYYTTGLRIIAFLQEDEFGIAEWRPAAWGAGLFVVHDAAGKAWADVPTLEGVRRAVGPAAAASPATGAGEPLFPQPAAPAPGSSHSEALPAAAIALGVLALAWAPAAVRRLRRRAGRP